MFWSKQNKMNFIQVIKQGYKLNTDTLVYEKVKLNWKRISIYSFCTIVVIGVVCFAFVKLFIGSIETPKEVILVNQNQILQTKYKEMQTKLDSFSTRLELLNRSDDSVYRAVFGKKPISKSIRMAGIGGQATQNSNQRSNDLQIITETDHKIKQLNNQLKISESSFKSLIEIAVKQRDKLKHIPAIMPVHNRNLERTGSGFGRRYHPILGIWRLHEGLDFNAPKGTKIFATANGKVKKCYVSKTFGNCVIIDHGYGYETYYAHLQKFNVKQGKQVKRGDVIGYMGSSGLSSGVHLHYEVHLNGVEVNPVNYFYNDLTPDEYQQIIEIADSFENSMD